MLKGGQKLWAPACTGQDLTLQGGDKVKSYLLLATSCDGTLCTTVQFISLRVVCNDTLQGSTGTIKVPHSTQFDATAVKTSLGLGLSHWNEFQAQAQAQAKALAQRPVAPIRRRMITRRLWRQPCLTFRKAEHHRSHNQEGAHSLTN
ncbi:MAG: DUF932 domain-containing protein [Shewanella sp.]